MALRLDAKSIALSKKLNALDKDDEKNREKVIQVSERIRRCAGVPW